MLDSANRLSGQGHWRSRLPWLNLLGLAAVFVAATLVTAKNLQSDPANEILNVSYDPTRELYGALDAQFVAEYQKQTGIKLHIKQSHGGSSRQARSVIDGSQKAGVVTLALPTDVETLAKRGVDRGRLAGALTEQFSALYLDSGLRRPKGQSKGDPRLA